MFCTRAYLFVFKYINDLDDAAAIKILKCTNDTKCTNDNSVQVGYSTKIQDVRRSGQIPGLKDSCSRVRDAQRWRPWRKKWMV